MVAVSKRDAEACVAAPPEGIRLFLVYGSDAGAITERARRLERAALQRGRGETVLRFGSDEISADPGRITDEAYAASLFGGEPVISLRVLDGRHNVIGALQPLIDRPPDAAWLVVEAGELNTTSPLRKAFEASPAALVIATYPLEGADLAPFIRSAADAAGLTVEPDALELLVSILGGDRLASRGELDKLFLYVGDRMAVTVADVRAIVGDTAESDIDHILDAALLGDNEALEIGLDRLRSEGGSAAGLASQALRHLLQLQALRTAIDAGTPPRMAVERHRPPIFGRRQPAVIAALGRWPSTALAEARRTMNRAVLTTRLLPSLEQATVSAALHDIALEARRLARKGRG
jgi:DNA polymerase-3 subunit delta